MSIENTDLERRVLAHEQILQALMAQLAESEPDFLDRMHGRFAGVRLGAHEHDYVETADYAEAFLHEVARLVRIRRATASAPTSPVPVALSPGPPAQYVDDLVVIRSNRSGGVWHVTRNSKFFGDYISEAAAHKAAEDAALDIERLGGRVERSFATRC